MGWINLDEKLITFSSKKIFGEWNKFYVTDYYNVKYIDIEKGIYALIICFNYLHRSLIKQIKDGLLYGGMVVYETYITDQARLFGKPRNPDYLLKHNELLNMFRDFRCLRYREGVVGDRRAIAGIVAQKI